jgi:hypothetical protein
VQQTQARAIKEDLTEAFIDNFTNAIEGAELLYTPKGTPALSLPNGLIITLLYIMLISPFLFSLFFILSYTYDML